MGIPAIDQHQRGLVQRNVELVVNIMEVCFAASKRFIITIQSKIYLSREAVRPSFCPSGCMGFLQFADILGLVSHRTQQMRHMLECIPSAIGHDSMGIVPVSTQQRVIGMILLLMDIL